MLDKAELYILLLHFKGVPVEDILTRTIPAPKYYSPELVLIDGHLITEWMIKTIYEVPSLFWMKSTLYDYSGTLTDSCFEQLLNFSKEMADTTPYHLSFWDRIKHEKTYEERHRVMLLEKQLISEQQSID